jgi:chemotaxis protein methyltransferase CheR
MKHADAAALLRWAAPRLGLRSEGFRNVQGQVCKRIRQRASELGLAGMAAYRERLELDAAEWSALQQLCFVTISRFYRDAPVWQRLREQVLPALAAARRADGGQLRCWSVGCASGEEPYTLAIIGALELQLRYPQLELQILATDLDAQVLARAAAGRYAPASLQELPEAWRRQAFEPEAGALRLRAEYRAAVELRRADVRAELPEQVFDLILCRNVVFTYFEPALQLRLLRELGARSSSGAALVVGRGERLPAGAPLQPWWPELGIYRRS